MTKCTMDEIIADRELDVCGLNCPAPILRTKKTLAQMQSGQVLHVLVTDPSATQDFEAFCKQTGNTLVAKQEQQGLYEFFLRRK